MSTVLLVCGSRSLEHRGKKARSWANRILREELLALQPRKDAVISGGAQGPDLWTRDMVMKLADKKHLLHFVEFFANGCKLTWECAYTENTRHRTDTTRWYPIEPKSPLLRNMEMASSVERGVVRGWKARVLALLDPRSPTQGTAHMLSCLAEKNFPIEGRWEVYRG